ncbi:DUF2062 domain-containing protein [Agriterribacter sp.]|uniref:DUF2062 domain-containing protein n=1 Tax=Agriterribacter sp. TaxID=2821509 RepID=UPI002C308281|nr:DUF2062 domain-containing protein [Agriterribacter sp.]HTN08450.1 DUF2062 domain-containing protein [Agriterribacter sp.]
MSDKASLNTLFNLYRACVIIPTYNNADTLPAVIADVAAYTRNIIVVNDGSTDDTAFMLTALPHIDVISHSKNKGKGIALRKGFERAVELGYLYAIAIDSDGQHFASDLPVFINKLKEAQDAIIIGARNMNQSSVPGKSSFGYKFSNFWFKIETGINAPDTQSGYRLYPVALMKEIRFFTRKYEFEIEVLVRAAWKGIAVTSVPVSVYYAPKEKRVSHFRPFRDFLRISLLNTLLVLIAFLYIKPRNFIRLLFKKRNWGAFFREQVLNENEPHYIKAFSVALGICMGIMPVWGFQLVTAIFLSIVLKLNKALVIIAANISIPPLIPLIIFFSYKTGAVWMKNGGGQSYFFKQPYLRIRKEQFSAISLWRHYPGPGFRHCMRTGNMGAAFIFQ